MQAPEELKSIGCNSPHLAVVLGRLAPRWPTLEAAFEYAIARGGREECDFVREPDVSFNPRAARIPLILINDAQCREERVLAAATLATAAPDTSLEGVFDDELIALATLSHRPPQALLSSQPEGAASLIASALHLDRARHYHLAPGVSAERWEEFLALTEDHIQLAERCSRPLHILLSAWCERARRGRITRSKREGER